MHDGNINLAQCEHLVPVASPVCCRRASGTASRAGSGGGRGGRAAWVAERQCSRLMLSPSCIMMLGMLEPQALAH